MKKQFLFTAVIISGILFSCTKEKLGAPTDNSSEMTSVANSQKGGGGGGSLSKGLLGRYTFDSTLKDVTGQLADGVSNVRRVLYTKDRKGAANSAIYFNAAYGVDIFDVPCTPDGASISFWIKHDTLPTPGWISSVSSFKGFAIQQEYNFFQASYYTGFLGTPPSVLETNGTDKNWHHMAATRDNNELRFYIDGVLIGTAPTPAGAGPYPAVDNYILAHAFDIYWKGCLDDLRFYKRVLTPAEVAQLAIP